MSTPAKSTSSAFLWSSLCLECASGDLHEFPLPWQHKARIRPVEGRVGSVYGTVVIRADEHHVVQRIIATAAKPVDVVRFTEIVSVQGLGIPSAKLTHAVVQLP